MNIDGEKSYEGLFARSGMDRCVHHRVVEMLALHRRMITDDDIAFEQPFAPVNLEPVAHRGADRIRDEGRHPAGRLRDEMPLDIDKTDGEILIFIDIRAEGRAGDVGVDLVRDRNDTVTQHFERDRIELGLLADRVHVASPHVPLQLMRISPIRPTSNRSLGPMTVVEPYSSITAGPAAVKPAGRVPRS